MSNNDRTMLDRLDALADTRSDRPAVLEPRDRDYTSWERLTWAEYRARVEELARAFIALGHQRKDAVGILGANSISWVVADLAAMAAGGMPAGIYSTLTPDQIEYILGHSGASICMVQDGTLAERVLAVRDRLPKLKALILFKGAQRPESQLGRVMLWDEAIACAAKVGASELRALREASQPDDVATLIYTSGTTGPPKAVALTHRNLTWTADVTRSLINVSPGDRSVSYLPLSHIAEQMLTLHVPISLGTSVHFVPVLEDLPKALVAVRPNSFFGVPRVWEKIQARVEAGVGTAPPARVRLFRAAQAVGLSVERARFEGRDPPRLSRLAYPLFERLVYSKLKARLGFDQTRIFATGAAPMSAATRDWFLSLGIPISEVYGQSEDSGPSTFNRAGSGRLGTAGRPIPGIELRLAEDGEILVRGPNVFAGYLHDPDATRATMTDDGFLKSGDIGELDAAGFLKITDRKKDLLITSGGKNVAPQNIERLLRDLPLVSQAVVMGDRRNYLVALLTVKPDELEKFSRAHGAETLAPGDPRVRAEIERGIAANVNPQLARYETVKRFDILPDELSEARGEMTPTLKIKRKVVAERYAPQIEALYDGRD
jgi:long-chain acyl-CoA synthetase